MRGLRHQFGFSMLELLLVLFIVSLLIMISYPFYRNYTIRAKIVEGIGLIGPAKHGIMEYYLGNNQLPTNNEQAGIAAPDAYQSHWVHRIEITDTPPGAIHITYDSAAVGALGENNTLIFVPVLDAVNNRMLWDCTHGTLVNKYRPHNCRNAP